MTRANTHPKSATLPSLLAQPALAERLLVRQITLLRDMQPLPESRSKGYAFS